MKKLFKWISEVLFGVPTKEELPDPCVKVFQDLENEKNIIWQTSSIPKEEIDKYPVGNGTVEFNVILPEKYQSGAIVGNTFEGAEEYISKSKEVKHTITGSDAKLDVYTDGSFEVKPRLGAFMDAETGKPLVRERPIRVNEEKADKVKKTRKPRNKKKDNGKVL